MESPLSTTHCIQVKPEPTETRWHGQRLLASELLHLRTVGGKPATVTSSGTFQLQQQPESTKPVLNSQMLQPDGGFDDDTLTLSDVFEYE